MRGWPAALALACACSAACASTGARCQQDVSDCIARCESVSGPSREPARDQATPEQTMTECERRCQCRPRPAGQQPVPKPTPTGM